MAAACGSLKHMFDNPLPENPTLLESLSSSLKQIQSMNPLQDSSLTEIFGELHFKEHHSSSPLSSASSSTHTQNPQWFDKEKSPNHSDSTRYYHQQYYKHGGHHDFSSKNSDSLSLCTEGLGFESSDDIEDSNDVDHDWLVSKERPSFSRHELKRSRLGKGPFPPPISSIGRSGKPWVCFRSYREDGSSSLFTQLHEMFSFVSSHDLAISRWIAYLHDITIQYLQKQLKLIITKQASEMALLKGKGAKWSAIFTIVFSYSLGRAQILGTIDIIILHLPNGYICVSAFLTKKKTTVSRGGSQESGRIRRHKENKDHIFVQGNDEKTKQDVWVVHRHVAVRDTWTLEAVVPPQHLAAPLGIHSGVQKPISGGPRSAREALGVVGAAPPIRRAGEAYTSGRSAALGAGPSTRAEPRRGRRRRWDNLGGSTGWRRMFGVSALDA
nr:protein FANTASTIC FOUR 1-like [Ipomoea batatas]